MRGAVVRRSALALAALALSAGLAGAQQVASQPAPDQTAVPQSPILTIDRERLFKETLFGKAVEARIKADSDDLIAENLKLETALEAEERDLTDRRAKLPAAEFQVLAKAFDAKAEQIRAAQQAKASAISDKRDAEQQRFLDAAVPVLGDLMRDSGAAAIFEKNMIVLSFRGIDITDRAIARIDAVLGNGDTSQPPADPAQPPKPEPQAQP